MICMRREQLIVYAAITVLAIFAAVLALDASYFTTHHLLSVMGVIIFLLLGTELFLVRMHVSRTDVLMGAAMIFIALGFALYVDYTFYPRHSAMRTMEVWLAVSIT
ncbi:hypothetical protein [Thermococcus sp. Bubb.Bath]|uniref:hypothetical protein n=1 Tax=Thermococcus sp. Bubb.Bath TaxID=1638242 RepID=UPI00143CB7A0|nr:hypothetical protein [Thermococcus sp. Bubb.Bath]NJF25086.1 hypothetical protein [Thermococcus sp. Bubb.Bath]